MSETKTQRRIRVRARLAEMLKQGYNKSKIYSKTQLYENDKIVELLPNQKETYTIRFCEDCQDFKVFNGKYCGVCVVKKSTYKHKCPECGEEWKTNSPRAGICSNCGSKSLLSKYYHKCEKCGFEEISNCPNSAWSCPNCGDISNRKRKLKCEKCGHIWDSYSPKGVCPNCKDKSKLTLYSYKCPECGEEWETYSPNAKSNKNL